MLQGKFSGAIWKMEGGGRPRKKKDGQEKSLEEKIDILKSLLSLPEYKDLINCNGKLKEPSNIIYQNLSTALEDLDCRISPKYIYTIILDNRFGLKNEYLEKHNIQMPIEESFTNNSTINSANFSRGCYVQCRLNVSDIWTSISPETVAHKFSNYHRNVRTLRRNSWTHVLFEEIYNTTTIPCALNFKSPKMTESGIFITVSGTCSECPCEFEGLIANEPQEGEAVYMNCSIYNFDSSVEHKKKRQLKGVLRTAVANKLLSRNILPCTYRRNEAHRLLNFGEDDSPILFENDILRKAKTEAFDKALGIYSKDIMENLLALKYHEVSEGAIHEIGLDPFYVLYWTKEQEILYKTFPEKLFFDGSGSIVKCLRLPNGEMSSHVYIYQGCIDINGKTAPVCQMLSTSQNTVTILHWMLQFIRSTTSGSSVVFKTQEIVTDFDKALLGASCRAFTYSQSLKHYLCVCFDFLMHKSPIAPSCLLRLDICHYMNMCSKWKCYPVHQPLVRSMYVRTMALLRKQETFADLKKVAEAIFMLALCPTTEKESLADQALQYLKGKIRDIPDDIQIQESVESQSENEKGITEESELDTTNIYQWAKDTYEKCQNEANQEPDHEEINAYHLPEFANKVKVLLPWFPIFSEVMRNVCKMGTKDATSAPVESEINDLKNRKFHNVKFPLRADKFVAFHLKALNIHLVEISAGIVELTDTGEYRPCKTQKKRKNDCKDENAELNEEHNWRNKNKNPKLHLDVENSNSVDQNSNFSTISEEVIDITVESNSDVDFTVQNNPVDVGLTMESSPGDLNNDISPKETENFYTPNEDSNIICEKNNSTSDEDLSTIYGLDPVKDLKKIRERQQKNRKKEKKCRYGDPLPHFDPSQKKHLSLPILPNGTLCRNVKDKSTIYVMKRTYAFDSLCQIVSLALLNNKNYEEALDHLDDGIFKCAKLLISQGLKVPLYKQRAIILQDIDILSKETTEHRRSNNKKVVIKKIDASCYICSLATILFQTAPSYSIIGECAKCKTKRHETVVLLEPNYFALENNGLINLSDTMKTVDPPKLICCKSKLKTRIQYGQHLLISAALGKKQSVEICDIQTSLTLNNEEYQLAGLVHYEGVYQIDYVGHYIAFVRFGNHWIEYDDARQKPIAVNNNTIVDPQILFFIKK